MELRLQSDGFSSTDSLELLSQSPAEVMHVE